ncbi:hypothetical protein JTE90_022242 [Oedothorax gibbosus]|uniref:Uncharacterized protein n=1 Tax=Oedothorax gibbosus TaxID=931172 RepID=A0AAV6VVL4_9ARAC|nr:hypothetical protein JTE90_022242 [Oedothorax gibbosus]
MRDAWAAWNNTEPLDLSRAACNERKALYLSIAIYLTIKGFPETAISLVSLRLGTVLDNLKAKEPDPDELKHRKCVRYTHQDEYGRHGIII